MRAPITYLMLLGLILLSYGVSATFCDDLILDIGTCKYTGTNVIVDMGPKDQAKLFALVFYTPEGEFAYQGASGIYNRRFQDVKISERGQYARFDWPSNSEPESIKLFHKDCVGKDYRFIQSICTKSRACTDSSVCPTSSFCDPSGFCEEITCTPCERIENHKCVPKCVDDSICTQDSCGADGTCSFDAIENCCEFDENCNDDLVCTQEHCSNFRCERSPLSCETNSCVEPTGCLSVETPWNSTTATKFSYRTQSLLIANPVFSSVLFVVVLFAILLLIYHQTSIDFRKMIVNSNKNRFVQPHARTSTKPKPPSKRSS